MDTHKNAPLTPKGREMMVRAVVDGGLSKAAAARRFNTTRRPSRSGSSGSRPRGWTVCATARRGRCHRQAKRRQPSARRSRLCAGSAIPASRSPPRSAFRRRPSAAGAANLGHPGIPALAHARQCRTRHLGRGSSREPVGMARPPPGESAPAAPGCAIEGRHCSQVRSTGHPRAPGIEQSVAESGDRVRCRAADRSPAREPSRTRRLPSASSPANRGHPVTRGGASAG